LNEITEYLKNNNVTMVFEVIDPENDPHIVEYQYKRVWLLDIIDNTIDFNKKSYDELCKIAKEFKMSVKEKCFSIDTFENMKLLLVDDAFVSNCNVEGYVIEDANGYMFKYKVPFYTLWKKMRGIKQQIQKGNNFVFNNLDDKAKEIAQFMLKNYSNEELSNISIIDVRKSFEKAND
jgi:tRNA splicing ligase